MKRLLLLLVSVALFADRVSAQTAPLRREPNRFLFLVDRSFSMGRIDDETRQVVFDMIYGGLDEQMRFGDEYALWTFDEDTQTRLFPLQNWDPHLNLSLASRAAKFLKTQPCQKKTRMDKAIADAWGVVHAVSNLNVLLITDGGAPVKGTPFDEPINAVFHERRKVLRHEKKPFIAMLAARGGEIVGWTVHAAGERLVLPKLPTTTNVIQVALSPAVAPPPALPPPAPKPAEPVVATAPPPVKPETAKPAAEIPAPPKPVPAEPAPAAVAAKPEPPPPARPAPPPLPVAPPKVEAPPPAVPPVTAAETKPVVPAPPAAVVEPVKPALPAPAGSTSTSTPPAVAQTDGALTGVEATNQPSAAPGRLPAQTALAVTSESFYSSRGLLFAGFGLLLVAAWLGIALFRRSRVAPQPSIITRSLERKEK